MELGYPSRIGRKEPFSHTTRGLEILLTRRLFRLGPFVTSRNVVTILFDFWMKKKQNTADMSTRNRKKSKWPSQKGPRQLKKRKTDPRMGRNVQFSLGFFFFKVRFSRTKGRLSILGESIHGLKEVDIYELFLPYPPPLSCRHFFAPFVCAKGGG